MDGRVIPLPPATDVSAGEELLLADFDRDTVTVAALAGQDAESGMMMLPNQFPLSAGVKENPPDWSSQQLPVLLEGHPQQT